MKKRASYIAEASSENVHNFISNIFFLWKWQKKICNI